MSFAIEVPGEAVPLSLQDLGKALQAGTSHDHSQRQAATQQLEEWQTRPGFYTCLQNVFIDRSLPTDIRLLAIILLKNGVDRNWRSASSIKGSIHADEKALIRSRLFQMTVDEPEKALALQSAVLTAKIVRIDYPRDWPTALPDLVAILRTTSEGGDPGRLGGTLQLLLRVIKELASARLRKSQLALQATASDLFLVLCDGVYRPATEAWIQLPPDGSSPDPSPLLLQNSLAALKVLRRLTVSGFDKPGHSQLVQQFWVLAQTHLERLLQLCFHPDAATLLPAALQDTVGKHLLQLAKLHIDVCELHPASFALLPNTVPLVRVYWGIIARFADMFTSSSGLRHGAGSAESRRVEGPLLEKLALKGLLLLKSAYLMVSQPKTAFKNRDEDTRREQAQAKEVMATQLFTGDFLLEMVNVIVSKLFVFRPSDLEAWDEDPEEWEAAESESGTAFEWQVRPCAERLFLMLLIKNKELLVPPLMAYFQQTMSGDLDGDLLKKEAVYTAMGNAALAIAGQFDFDAFVTTTLVKDAQVRGSDLARVLRRRVAMLLAAWSFHDTGPAATAAVYQISAHLLQPDDNDLVVRLTAARQIRKTVDITFSADAFRPYSTSIFGSLMALLQQVEGEETKLVVLETIRVLIERMETSAAQFSDAVVAALPAVWDAAGADAYMIKQAVLAVLTSLVMALQAASQRYHEVVLPLIADVVNPQSPVHENLVEEAVELWAAVLSMSASTPPSADTSLLAMLPAALPLLEYDSAVVESCLRILHAYIVVAPAAVLADAGLRRPVLQGLAYVMDLAASATESATATTASASASDPFASSSMTTARLEQVQAAAAAVRRLLHVALVVGGTEGVAVVVDDMVTIGMLPRMLERIHGAWQAHQATGPRAPASPITTTAEVQYFSILSWVALADPQLLVRVVTQHGDVAAVWPWLGAEWFSIFETLGSSEHLKLACLGLTRLCELPQQEMREQLVLGRLLQDYFSMWTSAVADAQGDAAQPDCYVWAEGAPPPAAYETPLQTAENVLAAQEPVHTERTYDFVVLRLQSLVAGCGGEQAFEANWAVNVDRDVLAGFRRLSQ